jgi:hypothetical protein
MTIIKSADFFFRITDATLIVGTCATYRIQVRANVNGKLFVVLKNFLHMSIVFDKVRRIPLPFKPKGTKKVVRTKEKFHPRR